MNQTAFVRDQALHIAMAAIVISLAIHGGLIGGVAAGFICGMIREAAESGNPVTFAKVKTQLTQTDAPVDLIFWTIGGLIAAALA